MSTKLTLTIDKEVISEAKAYAQSQGKSLSELVENYLKSISSEKKKESLSPTVKKLSGAFKVSNDFDYKKELSDTLAEKYLK
jgi:hypothetical protein